MTIQTYPEDASPAVVTDTVEDKVVHSLSIYPRGTTPYVGSQKNQHRGILNVRYLQPVNTLSISGLQYKYAISPNTKRLYLIRDGQVIKIINLNYEDPTNLNYPLELDEANSKGSNIIQLDFNQLHKLKNLQQSEPQDF